MYQHHKKVRKLSDAEILEAKEAVVEHLQKIQTYEGELAVQKKKYADKLKPHKSLVKDLMRKITTGVDEGEAYCRIIVDTVTETVRFVVEKRAWNDETQRYETTDELFDEKTFAEVGERQLTIWQSGEDIDLDDDSAPDLHDDEQESFHAFLKEHGISTLTHEILHTLYFAEDDAIADFLEATGEPYSKVRIAMRTQSLADALDFIGEYLPLKEFERLSEKLFAGFDDNTAVAKGALLGRLVDWAGEHLTELAIKDDEEQNA